MSIGEAVFRKTTIYSAEVQRADGVAHVIGYQNRAVSYGPNAMLLPFPAEGKVTRDNLVNGAGFKDILNVYQQAVKRLDPNIRRSRSFSDVRLGSAGPAAAKSFEVFESGSYTVALCEKPSAIGHALKEVPESRRPNIPYPFLLELTRLYPDWPIALCCFNNSEFDAEPLFWWYKPRFPEVLFAPAIDAHNGKPPQLDIMVNRDHSLAFASYTSDRPVDPFVMSAIERVPFEHRWLFDPRVCGRILKSQTGNGDFAVPLNQVRDNTIPAWLDIKVAKPPQNIPTRWDRLLTGEPLV
jgi:hypothetical protein